MRTLITGGLGFLGSNLAKKCIEEGYGVTLISKTDSKKENIKGLENKLELILKDVQDIDKELSGMDYIFHLASIVHNKNVLEDPLKEVDVNCRGTIALLEACRKHNPDARIVYVSTFFVNGPLEDLPATPSSPTNPQSIYAATRLAGEHFSRIYNENFNMNIVIARPINIFGIREQGDITKAAFNNMIKLAVDGKEISLYGGGEMERDYLYVSDAVDALLALAEKGETGKTYYIGRGEGIKMKDLVGMVIKESGSGSVKNVEIPTKAGNSVTDFYCDNSPLKELGWKPKISIIEGIRMTIDFYRKEHIKSL